MRPTRRFWTVAAATVLLCIAGVLWARPVLFIGAGGLGAWLLARQYLFVREANWTAENLDVIQQVTSPNSVEEPVRLDLRVNLSAPASVPILVEPSLPGAAQAPAERAVSIQPGETSDERRTEFTIPVAGTYQCDSPVMTLTDRAGLFTDTIEHGGPAEFRLRPGQPTDVRVGGREDIAGLLGESEGQEEASVVSSSVRKYYPGDPVEQIDWNSTARMQGTFVREFEVETPVVYVFIVDARDRVWSPESGVTKFEYLREVCLRAVDVIENGRDPVGLIMLGAEGEIGLTRRPEAVPRGYALLRRDLNEVSAPVKRRRTRSGHTMPARSLDHRLNRDRSAFGPRLRTFLDSSRHADGGDVDPLVRAVQQAREMVTEDKDLRLALLTDDSDHIAVRRAVQTARTEATYVQVYMTPSVLFEPRRLVDVEDAYDRYRRFERFREELNSARGVSAFEVGPAERIQSIGRRAEVQRP